MKPFRDMETPRGHGSRSMLLPAPFLHFLESLSVIVSILVKEVMGKAILLRMLKASCIIFLIEFYIGGNKRAPSLIGHLLCVSPD